MATKNISPVAPKEIQRTCQLWSDEHYPSIVLVGQGKTNYYQADLLLEVISLILQVNKDKDRDQLRQVERWILSNVKWTIDDHRGQELDRSKPLEKG